MITYGKQNIDEDDIRAVVEALRSDYLTTGSRVGEFEQAICDRVEADYGVAVSSGTAALHAAMSAIGIEGGDEVIIPAITFVATANCVLYQGGKFVCCDVRPDNLLIDINKIEPMITPRTKAIIAMDYAGLPCDYKGLQRIAKKHGLYLISDACHSLGAQQPIADITCYSFHPVKHITTGEGGMAVTNNQDLADKMRRFRCHGMQDGNMVGIGYNYRITDIQCALGISQLKKLDGWIEQRREIAKEYDKRLDVVKLKSGNNHVYHLYVVRLKERDRVFEGFKLRGIATNIHYKPVYCHPYLGWYKTDCPEAEKAYKEILTLPIYPGFDKQDYVIKMLEELV